jgi:KDO2-lipid IV(A) lauroyltransferase
MPTISSSAQVAGVALLTDYDAVSLILRKRMSHGLQADVHYTWSKTMEALSYLNSTDAKLEEVIREYPDQWLWIHRRWKTRPPGEAALY